MTLSLAVIISGVSLALVFLVFVMLIIKHKTVTVKIGLLQSQVQANDVLINEMQSFAIKQQDTVTQFESIIHNQQTENIQVSKQLEHRIKALQNQLKEQQSLFEQIQNQQPEDKLYSRAFKLVELGADIEEIMRECEIPRAEADMLISIHQKGIDNQ